MRQRVEQDGESQEMTELVQQILGWPITMFEASLELFARTFPRIAKAEVDGLVSRLTHILNRDLKNDVRQVTAAEDPAGVNIGTGEGEIEMRDKDLSGDDLKLVRYKVLFVKRDYEVAFPECEDLVADNLSGVDFTAWKIAEFIASLKETKVPNLWLQKNYPREFRNETSPMVESLPQNDKQYLRVHYEVLANYCREKFHYEERQVAVLEEIRDHLRKKVQNGGNGKPDGKPGWTTITLPTTLCLAGTLDSSQSQFGDEFFNFPPFMGERPAPGGTRLSGGIEFKFNLPQKDKANFSLTYYSVGTDDMIHWGKGAEYKFHRDRAFQNPTPFNAQGKPDPTMKSGGTLDLKTGEIENMTMHAIFQNSVIAIVDKLNRIPFGFPNDYPPPQLPQGVELPFPDRPPMFSRGRFKINERGELSGFEFHGETIAPVTLFPFMGLFPPFSFGPKGAFYFANPTDCPAGTLPKNCPDDTTNPDGIQLPLSAFFHPHLDLVTSELREAPAEPLSAPCLPSGPVFGGVMVAVEDSFYYLGGTAENGVTSRVDIHNLKNGSWTIGVPMPTAVSWAQGAVIGKQIYVAGGRLARGAPSNTLQSFDLSSGKWHLLKPMPKAVSNAVGAAVDGKLYVIGGETSAANKKAKLTPEVQIYDPETDSWSAGAELPKATAGSASVTVDSRIFVINGRTSANDVTNEVFIYSTMTDRWRSLQSTPTGVTGAVAAYHANGLYLVGGRFKVDGPTQTGVQLFEFATSAWRSGPEQPLPAAESAIAVLQASLYVAGGRIATGADQPPGTATDAVQVFDPARGWSVCASKPYFNSADVLNAASLTVGGDSLSPGSRACIIGYNLTKSPAVASGEKPTVLGGVTINVDNLPAPIFSVAPNRVDFQIPYAVKFNKTHTRTVPLQFSSGGKTISVDISISAAAPGIFIYSYGETREHNFLHDATALACNPDGTLNYPAQPACPGDTVKLYVTGLGEVTRERVSGKLKDGKPNSKLTHEPKVRIGGRVAKVRSAGLAPGGAGLYEIEVVVPERTPQTNNVPVEITVNDVQSNRAMISVQSEAWRPADPVPCELGKKFVLNE